VQSRASKILRRTLVGGSLAAAVALGLWWASRTSDRLPVLWIATAALLGAVAEVVRMGSLRGRVPAAALIAPAAAVVLLQHAAARAARDPLHWRPFVDADPALASWMHVPHLGVDYAAALLLAVLVFGLERCLRRVQLDGPWARAAIWLTLGFLFLLVFRDYTQVRYFLLVSAAPVTLVALSTLPVVLASGEGRRDLVACAFLALWLVVPLPALWRVAHEWGLGALVALLVLSKIGDTAGYYDGNAIGRGHPFPKLSPGKTNEGCVASLVAGMLAGLVCVRVGLLPAEPWGLWGGLAAGAVVNVAAQAGDLLESWVKRRTGVKDSSTVFGPSGGMLDQVDSLLLSIPTAIVTWPWIFSSLPGTSAG
jgi:phosphatidate cytidylyltransferase